MIKGLFLAGSIGFMSLVGVYVQEQAEQRQERQEWQELNFNGDYYQEEATLKSVQDDGLYYTLKEGDGFLYVDHKDAKKWKLSQEPGAKVIGVFDSADNELMEVVNK